MGKSDGPKLPSFCLSRIRPLVRVRSPTIQAKSEPETEHKAEDLSGGKIGNSMAEQNSGSSDHVKEGVGRKIMIVVDSSFEAKNALQWVLSHTVQRLDKIVLLHVTKPSSSTKQGKLDEESNKEKAPKGYELVCSMRNMCQIKKPELEIEVCVVQGKEKGPTIVEEAKKQGATMLVLGRKRRSATTWRLLMLWTGQRVSSGGGIVDYCIQNADCMAIAIRRKNGRHGGYLITTKRHKDFWLLA